LAQETDPSNPVAWLPALGPFAAAAAIMWVWIRDIKADRDRCREAVERATPANLQIADTFRLAVQTVEANTVAMHALREGQKDIQTRLRAIERSIERGRSVGR
jgi:hypothetical protein